MKSLAATVLSLAIATIACGCAHGSGDYSNRILGRWLGSKKLIVFHADGRWGVQRNEEAPEDIRGRRWRLDGRKLLLTYPLDDGLKTSTYMILSLNSENFVTEVDGHREEYQRSTNR